MKYENEICQTCMEDSSRAYMFWVIRSIERFCIVFALVFLLVPIYSALGVLVEMTVDGTANVISIINVMQLK